MITGTDRSQSGNVTLTYREGNSPRETCLHCGKRPPRTPYLYCGPCTQASYQVMQQASQRNHLTGPAIKVYRKNTKGQWALKGSDEV